MSVVWVQETTNSIPVVNAMEQGHDWHWGVRPSGWRTPCGAPFDAMICSEAALAEPAPMTGSCAPTSWAAVEAVVAVAAVAVVAVAVAVAVSTLFRSPKPTDPPQTALPPGVAFPIIGPELATYGVAASGAPIGAQHPRHARRPKGRHLRAGWLRRSACGRDLVCRSADQEVSGSADPEGADISFLPLVCAVASGAASSAKRSTTTIKPSPLPMPAAIWEGFQGGIDLLRGPVIPGGYDRAGLYGAYGDVHADVNGLVTNPAATAYVLNRTGSMNLNSWSAGGHWTHTGPGGWYLDAVLQGTWYYGSASTQFARLNTDGTGFIASLEGGYPFSWPQLGPGFVIEPQ